MAEYIIEIDHPELCVEYGGTNSTDRLERIVRCRDCEHCFVTRFGKSLCAVSRDVYYDLFKQVEPDGFCAWGKPRETGLHG